MNYDFNPQEALNAKQMYIPPKKKLEPKIDWAVSKIVGKKILALDPRLMRLIVKWKKQKKDLDKPDNFLKDPKKIEELKKVLGGSL
jgi:hypothetical protein